MLTISNDYNSTSTSTISNESRFMPSFHTLSKNTTALAFFLEFLHSTKDEISLLPSSASSSSSNSDDCQTMASSLSTTTTTSIALYIWLDLDHICSSLVALYNHHSFPSSSSSSSSSAPQQTSNFVPPENILSYSNLSNEQILTRLKEFELKLQQTNLSNQPNYLIDMCALYMKYCCIPTNTDNCTTFAPSSILSNQFKLSFLDSLIHSPTDYLLHFHILKSCQISLEILLKDKYALYLNSVYHLRYQLQFIHDCPISDFRLTDILFYDKILCLFNEFLHKNEMNHYLTFYLTVDGFENQFDIQRENQDKMEEALTIYNKYLSRESTTAIDLLQPYEAQIVDKMCLENGQVDLMCFHSAKLLIYDYLQKEFLQTFLRSQEILDFIRELTSQVKANERHSVRLSDSHSDALSIQSEPFVQTKATTTASSPNMESSLWSHKQQQATFADEYLLQPDKLWERKKNRSLLFGYVDVMGQFHSEINRGFHRRYLDSSSTTSLVNIWRRFKNQTDTEDNRTPLEIASGIVDDICRVNFETASRFGTENKSG